MNYRFSKWQVHVTVSEWNAPENLEDKERISGATPQLRKRRRCDQTRGFQGKTKTKCQGYINCKVLTWVWWEFALQNNLLPLRCVPSHRVVCWGPAHSIDVTLNVTCKPRIVLTRNLPGTKSLPPQQSWLYVREQAARSRNLLKQRPPAQMPDDTTDKWGSGQ